MIQTEVKPLVTVAQLRAVNNCFERAGCIEGSTMNTPEQCCFFTQVSTMFSDQGGNSVFCLIVTLAHTEF